MDFRVGAVVVITDGNHKTIGYINGIKNGYLKVGYMLFDWCGNEVDVPHRTGFKIYPIENKIQNNA